MLPSTRSGKSRLRSAMRVIHDGFGSSRVPLSASAMIDTVRAGFFLSANRNVSNYQLSIMMQRISRNITDQLGFILADIQG